MQERGKGGEGGGGGGGKEGKEGRSGRVVVLGNFQCQGILLIWTIEGQGPIVLAIGVGWGCVEFFSLICLLFSFSFSQIETEIMSRRVVEPPTTEVM